MVNGLCDYLVCVRGCNTENDKWFSLNSPCIILSITSLHTIQLSLLPFTQTIPSHKPFLHTNHLSFSVIHIIWLMWRDVIQKMINGLCEGLVCVEGLCEPSLYNSLYYILSGLCEGMVSVSSLPTNHLSFLVLHPFTQTIP